MKLRLADKSIVPVLRILYPYPQSRNVDGMGYGELKPQEDLVNYFELVKGRGLRTKADLENYLAFAQEIRPLWLHVNRFSRGWPLLKQLVLVALFAIALVQYVFIDAAVQIASLPSLIYFMPPSISSEESAARS